MTGDDADSTFKLDLDAVGQEPRTSTRPQTPGAGRVEGVGPYDPGMGSGFMSLNERAALQAATNIPADDDDEPPVDDGIAGKTALQTVLDHQAQADGGLRAGDILERMGLDETSEGFTDRLAQEISTMRAMASTPTPAEERYYDSLRQRQQELNKQRERYQAAAPGFARADVLSGVSEFLGRLGTADQITMGGIVPLQRQGADARRTYTDALSQAAHEVGMTADLSEAERSTAGREFEAMRLESMLGERAGRVDLLNRLYSAERASDLSSENAILGAKITDLSHEHERLMQQAELDNLLERAGMGEQANALQNLIRGREAQVQTLATVNTIRGESMGGTEEERNELLSKLQATLEAQNRDLAALSAIAYGEDRYDPSSIMNQLIR